MRGFRPSGRHEWTIVGLPIVWGVLVLLALAYTLDSLRHTDFDGLNNFYQIPLALPWFLVPTAAFLSYEQDAYVVAVEGLVNAGILHVWLKRRVHRSASKT